jgi:hypothetical protein
MPAGAASGSRVDNTSRLQGAWHHYFVAGNWSAAVNRSIDSLGSKYRPHQAIVEDAWINGNEVETGSNGSMPYARRCSGKTDSRLPRPA